MNEIDIKFETWPPKKGGQQCGTSNGVKASYDGIEAIVTCERSQYKNKMIAEDMILSAITHRMYGGKL